MAIRFSDLNVMLDEHFRLAPPLDSPTIPVSGEVSEFGTGISLGDGKSMADVRGLENIQVVEKTWYFDKVRQISMKDWLEKTIRKNPKSLDITNAVRNLLMNGQLSYFEQGREFATQLSLDPQTNKLNATPIKREALPPVKPTLTFKQKFLRLFGAFKGEEAEQYNRDLLSYEVKMKALATSEIRSPFGAGTAPVIDDGKGKILAVDDYKTKIVRNIALHNEISQLSPEKRSEVEHNVLMGENAQKAIELQIDPTLNWSKFSEVMYPNGQPDGISNFQDHINSRIEKQDSFEKVRWIKTLAIKFDIVDKSNTMLPQAVVSVMKGEDGSGYSEGLNQLMFSKAYSSIFNKPEVAAEQVATGKIFDQFAQNLERYPMTGLKPKAIENLLDVCIVPHPKLSAALKASKNNNDGVFKTESNNRQKQKQMEIQPKKQPEIQPEKQPEIQPKIQPEIQPEIQPKIQPEIQPKIQPEIQPEKQKQKQIEKGAPKKKPRAHKI